MSAWKRSSKAHPCAVCGHDGWCTDSGDGAVWCGHSDGGPVPGWRVVSRPEGGGTIYRRQGDAGPGPVSAADREGKRKAEEAEAAKRIAAARQWWRQSVPGLPAVAAYIESRGVRVADLPAGVPVAIRGISERETRLPVADDAGVQVQSTGPVMVAAAVSAGGELRAVQRVFLSAGGAGKRGPSESGPHAGKPLAVKLSLGPMSGCAVRLCREYPEGTLILTEGIETGLAVLAATGSAVWACVSTSGLIGLELPAPDAAPGGPIKRIVIAADHDPIDAEQGWRPGAHYAAMAARRLAKLHPHLEIAIADPSARAEGVAGLEELGEGVDWLDLYRSRGAEYVRRAIDAAQVVHAAEEATEATGPKAITENLIERARMAIAELYAPPQLEESRGWLLRRWDAAWWRHDGIRYVPIDEECHRADLRPWLNRWWHVKRNKFVPLDPPEKAIGELSASMQTDLVLQAEQMPCWLAPDFDGDGKPVWGQRRPWQRSLTGRDARAAGLPDPAEVIVFANGILDVQAWVRGEVRMMPHTERLFTATALPFDCPIEELERVAGDDEAMQEALERMCPTWLEFLGLVSGADPEWEQLLAQMFGYCLTPWTRYEVILVMSGATRAGKGTILNGLTSIIGEQNVASSDINLLTDKFHLYSLVGKTVCVMPDADVGRNTDAVRAAETLKKISGGDPVNIDRKHRDALAAVRLSCKILIMCNRMPSLPDPSGAIASRFRVLQFEESSAGREDWRYKDPEIMEREAAGRMMWALRGLRQLVQRDRFTQPEKGRQLLDEYRDYSDPLGKFRDECLERADAFEFASELYEVWKKWCRVEGREERSHSWFCKELRTACPWIDREQRMADVGVRKWGYRGLRVTDREPGQERISAASCGPLPPT